MKIYEDKGAQKVASRLSPRSRAYLLGDDDDPKIRGALMKVGYVETDGRLTPYGVRIARILAAESLWSADDSRALDAEIRASRKPRKPTVTRYADPALADACRKILAHPLRREASQRPRGERISGFPSNEPSRAFS